MVRIVDIRETVVPIKSKIRNAYIDFSQMTVSVLALITDVVRDGKPVVGFGFNSNGRYAPSGLLRDRLFRGSGLWVRSCSLMKAARTWILPEFGTLS